MRMQNFMDINRSIKLEKMCIKLRFLDIITNNMLALQ